MILSLGARAQVGKRVTKAASPDILDLVLHGEGFADDVRVEQVKTLLAAGHNTTSSTIASAAAILSRNPSSTVSKIDCVQRSESEKLQSMSSLSIRESY